jgi:spermidine/putrescine-binding protein
MIMKRMLGTLTVLATAVVITACATSTQGSSAGESQSNKVTGPLNLLLWEGYGGTQLIDSFEKQYGVKINVTYISSNDDVLAKIRTKSGAYDVVPATTDVSGEYINAGLVQPIDISQISNLAKVLAPFQNLPQLSGNGRVYGVPHLWSADPIIYNTDVVKTPQDSYKILWDPKYAGRISLYNDISSLWIGALVNGYADPYNLTDAQLASVVSSLRQQKVLVKKYWSSGGDLISLFQTKEVVLAQGWNYMYVQLKNQGAHIGRINPPNNLGWVDSLMVPANAKHAQAAALWINWALSGQSQASTATGSGYSPVNAEANQFLSKQSIQDLHMDDPKFVERIVLWKPVDRKRYLAAWNTVLN